MEVLNINGREREFPEGIPATLAELLDQLKISQATVLVLVEGLAVGRAEFAKTRLSPGQSVELLRFLGGG